MKNKNIISIVLFISLMNMLPPLLWRGVGGEADAQQTWTSLISDRHFLWTYHVRYVSDIKQTLDGGYIVLGENKPESSYASKTHPLLIKLNKNGMLEWSKDIGAWATFGAYVGGTEVQPTADGGYIVCGGVGEVTKTDNLGNVQWTKSYGNSVNSFPAPSEFCEFYSIQQTTDGGYIVAGTTANFGTKGEHSGVGHGFTGTDIYLVKLNPNGTIQWAKTYGNEVWYEEAYYVRQTKDGGYIIAGQNEQPNEGSRVENSGFLLKTNALGVKQWCKYYGTEDSTITSPFRAKGQISGKFNSVEETPNGGFIATGEMGVNVPGSLSKLSISTMVKTDNEGTIQWSKTYYSPTDCYGWGRRGYPTSDGGYIMYAPSNECQGRQNRLLFKTDAMGNPQWTRTYGPDDNYPQQDRSIQRSTLAITNDGGYAFTGHYSYTLVGTQSNPYEFNYVIKTDSLGKIGNCQNTKTATVVIPKIITSNFPVVTNTANYVIGNTYTAITYTLTVDTTLCLNAPITADFSSNNSCIGADSTSFGNYSNAGLFEWNFGDPTSNNNNTSTAISPKHKYNAVGTYTVTLKATDGDSNRDSVLKKIITIYPSKFISVGPDITVCSGDSALISFSSTVDFVPAFWEPHWLPIDSIRNPFNDSTYAYPTATTQYKATAYNGGCYDSDSLIINVIAKPTLTINGNTSICKGTASNLSAVGANNYMWNTGETTSSITPAPIINTSYTVTAYNSSCSFSQSIAIKILPSFTVDAGNSVTITIGDGVTLQALGEATNYHWYPSQGLSCTNCQNPTAKPSTTTMYYVTSNVGTLCPQTDSVTVYVVNCDEEVVIPNAFSPNNDNVNDLLTVTGTSCIQSISFKIYDRWGNKVFETITIGEAWDGFYHGKAMNAGVFVYSINAVTINGDTISKKGNITLIR